MFWSCMFLILSVSSLFFTSSVYSCVFPFCSSFPVSFQFPCCWWPIQHNIVESSRIWFCNSYTVCHLIFDIDIPMSGTKKLSGDVLALCHCQICCCQWSWYMRNCCLLSHGISVFVVWGFSVSFSSALFIIVSCDMVRNFIALSIRLSCNFLLCWFNLYLQRVVDTYWIDYAVLKRWCSWSSPSCFSLSFFLFLFWVFSFLFCAFVLFFIYIFFSSLFFCVHLSSWSSSSSILALTCWASQHYSWNVPWRLVLWQRVSMLVHVCHWPPPTVRKVMNSIGCHGICLILGIQVSENACGWCWV